MNPSPADSPADSSAASAAAPSPAPDTAPLAAVRAAFAAGHYTEALALLRPWPRAGADGPTRCEAEALHVVSAFRTGEMAEAAARAAVLNADPAAHLEATLPLRFDALAVEVVACGELLQYERALAAVRELLSLAGRLGGLARWVRARGTVSASFALLGDLEASRRVIAELAGVFQGQDLELRLEATVRGNFAATCLMLVREARAAGDDEAAAQALEDADMCVRRAHEIAQRLGDPRVAAFARVHEAERALLSAPQPATLLPLQAAAAAAASAGLAGHVRQLQLLQAEGQLACGDAPAALALLQQLQPQLHDGHEFGSRVRLHSLLARTLHRLGDLPAAWAARDRAEQLQALRQLRRAQAQSRFVRHRLELEHLFSRRSPTP